MDPTKNGKIVIIKRRTVCVPTYKKRPSTATKRARGERWAKCFETFWYCTMYTWSCKRLSCLICVIEESKWWSRLLLSWPRTSNFFHFTIWTCDRNSDLFLVFEPTTAQCVESYNIRRSDNFLVQAWSWTNFSSFQSKSFKDNVFWVTCRCTKLRFHISTYKLINISLINEPITFPQWN